MDKNMQASPNPRKIWATTCVMSHKWKKQAPLSRRWRRVLTSQDGSKRRVRIEDLVRHTMLLCGADAPPGRALRGNLARELTNAIPSEKGKGKGWKGASQMEIAQAPPR